MYEHKTLPLVSRRVFVLRQVRHAATAGGIVLGALAIGAVGYASLEGLGFVDSVYSAAMILTGMGPAMEVKTDAGKMFASVYALFSGVVFLTTASVLVAPLLHRLLHKLHASEMRGELQEEGVRKA